MSNTSTLTCISRDGVWHGTCQCGWSLTSRRSGHSGSSALAYVEAHGRTHLRTKHHASSPLRRSRGRTVTLSAINERLLNKAERERYAELTTAVSARTSGSGTKPPMRSTFRDHPTSIALFVLWVPVLAGAFALAMNEDKTPEPHPDPFLWLMLAVLLGGWIPAAMVMARELDDWRRNSVASYLDGIGFSDRAASPVTSSDDDNDYYKSKRQLDHEWYGDHSELNWRDREQAQAWGMDADTYVSNWLEHDKD
ncbi:hypothetical protein [Nocardioides sambongensis]|uniref:hypothetical protein n=1 Tax=Nocardioides sambongensis TaxID=2589074 RepID=UPI00112EB797|nr:hypothetical protein [Nocardioides sambongensis]